MSTSQNGGHGSGAGADQWIRQVLTAIGPWDSQESWNEASETCLTKFLSTPSCMLLQARILMDQQNSTLSIELRNSASESSQQKDASSLQLVREVNFVKTEAVELEEKNMQSSVLISTESAEGPLHSLYRFLHEVFSPELLQNPNYTVTMSDKIQTMLTNLEEDLNAAVQRSSSGTESQQFSVGKIAGIVTPADELKYWKQLEENESGQTYEYATEVRQKLEPVLSSFEDATSGRKSLAAVIELVEETSTALDDAWKISFSSQVKVGLSEWRMEHLFSVISNAIVRVVQSSCGCGSLNFWEDDFTDVRLQVRDCITLCETWQNTSAELTSTLWKGYDEHKWTHNTYNDHLMQRFAQRLRNILQCRATYNELTRLLPATTAKELQVERVVDPLQRCSSIALIPSVYTQSTWDNAVAQFEKLLKPLETEAIEALRNRLKEALSKDQRLKDGNADNPSMLDKPSEVLAEFSRFSYVFSRENIRQALSDQRQQVLALLSSIMRNLEGEFESQSARGQIVAPGQAVSGSRGGIGDISAGSTGRFSSRVVDYIVWAQATRSRVREMVDSAKPFLSELPEWEEFVGVADNLSTSCTEWQHSVFEEWKEATEDAIKQKGREGLNLHLNKKVVEFDENGNLVVNYSEGLVQLLREARQLSELGLRLPKEIAEEAKNAQDYFRYGLQMQKVAQFYNTMGTQIIPSQKPMLLEPLMEFEERVAGATSQSGEPVKWNDPEKCAQFVEQLQKSSEKVSSTNRKLRKTHSTLCREVVSLMQFDILRQKPSWKTKLIGIKDYLRRLIQAGNYREEQVIQWLRHWDSQLYKAVEIGYRFGLESLNEHLGGSSQGEGSLRAELIFSSGEKCITFQPSLEELRSQYYGEMRRFIALPDAIRSLQDVLHDDQAVQEDSTSQRSHLFSRMRALNANSLSQVYRKAEILFARLGKLKEKYEKWVVVGYVKGDIDSLVEENVVSAEDWERNVKSLKQVRKEAERLPDYERIDCVTVSLSKLKLTIEDHLDHLSNSLLWGLRHRLIDRVKTVESFLQNSIEQLNERPDSIDKISEAQSNWKLIADQKPQMQEEYRHCESEKQMLFRLASSETSSSGGRIDLSDVAQRLSRIPEDWRNLEIAMEAFHEMIDEQKENLKQQISSDIVEFNRRVRRFAARWEELNPASKLSDDGASRDKVLEIFESLEDWKSEVESFDEEAQTLSKHSQSFGLQAPTFDELESVKNQIDELMDQSSIYKRYSDDKNQLLNQDWISFRAHVFDLQDFASKWLDTVKEQRENQESGSIAEKVLRLISGDADLIRRAVPGLKFARGEAFKEEHWSTVFRKLGMPKGMRLENLYVSHFLEKSVLEKLTDADTVKWLKDLNSRAQGEVAIREALQELQAWCETSEFNITYHESSVNGEKTAIIKDWGDVFADVGDNQSLVGSLRDSPYFKPFADQAAYYESRFYTLDACMDSLNSIQRRWIYLEPIFGRGSLPSEASRFNRVDKEFKNIMGRLESDPKVINLADDALFPNLQSTLTSMSDQLDRCMKALSSFLEEKRNKMPRFYFLGDDDLLEILGRAEDPEVIQSHLKKLFQGINRVKIETLKGKQCITQIISSAGEVVTLFRPVTVDSNVTSWLENLSREMVFTLRKLLSDCVQHGRDEPDYLEKYPSQVLSVAESIRFTSAIEAALKNGEIAKVREQVQLQMDEYTSIDFSAMEGAELLRLKVKSLVLDLIHQVDICSQLEKAWVKDRLDWNWQKQLRYYLCKPSQVPPEGLPVPAKDHPSADSSLCVINMCDATLNYTYEYQGNAPKLVYTPLTDKCYLTLTQGIASGCGGNPYGPAGTGKTESVKALGNALGRQVLVFNCDEGIDFQSMGRIFTGLVKCGAWGCFDEFNRLKADQLSAVSGQIQVIQASIKDGKSEMELLGKHIDVNPHAGIFVTMNPAGKGYGGRSKLPDNLKALFRPVAMSRPDNEQIAETLLFSEGFKNAQELGRKVASLFAMASQLLSIQQHYDWGLRAMKTVLNTGGALIRSSSRDSGESSSQREKETNLLVKAIRVNTMSKLTYDDSMKFSSLLADVFPGAVNEDIEYEDLAKALRQSMQDPGINLQVDESQVNKMQQLKEALDQRMGCVLVGPSGCGKTTLWRVLERALSLQGVKVVTHVMNPKSMPRERLLGWMDPDTREWHDGALTAAARAVVREPQSTRCWIVCDGDIDPEWIESLNSVLDDNHLLTLPNGERISFGDNINFLFETHDLTYASPATISRMGMIFLSEDDIDIQRLVGKWLESKSEDIREALQTWIESTFYPALQWIFGYDVRSKGDKAKAENSVDFVVETTLVGMVKNALSHIEAASTPSAFGLGLIRGLGGNLETEKRSEFAKFVFECVGERLPDPRRPLDFFCDEHGSLQQYQTKIPDFPLDISQESEDDMVPLVDTVTVQRTKDMVSPWIDTLQPFVLVGPEGSGKAMLIRSLVEEKSGVSLTVLDCNSETHPEHVVDRLRQSCGLYTSSRGKVFRPREGDRLVLFLRNINLPRPDKYDTCPLVAFLHQLVAFNGFYDESLQFLRLEKVQIIASMNPSSTVGRYKMSSRFTSSIRIAYMDYPSLDELRAVASAYLYSVQEYAGESESTLEDSKTRQELAKVTVSIWDQVRNKFSSASNQHYSFTPREITSWLAALCRYDLKSEPATEVLAYECQRVFRDRLVSAKDVASFDTLLVSMLKSTWRVPLDQGFGFPREDSSQDRELFSCLREGSTGGRVLQRIRRSDLQGIVERGITLYEREERELRLVLFPEVLENIAAVDRALSCDGGSLVLVGRSGVGRRSATSLVSFMLGMEFKTFSVSRTYGRKQFQTDLKSILARAGVEGYDVCVFVEDHVIEQLPSVAEAINSLLSSGEVPGLYTHDELESVLAPLKDELESDVSGQASLYSAFVRRVKQHLRIVISLDAAHPHFRRLGESNPAFFSRTSILWMGSWRHDSLSKIPPKLIPDMFTADKVTEVDELLRQMVNIHSSAEAYITKSSGATPLDYISFLHAYEGLYQKKVKGIKDELEHLSAGLEKLQEAESHVDELAQEAAQYKETVSKKQAEADNAMTQITEALETASSRRHEMKELQEKLSKAEEDILKDKEKIDEELADVQPVLDAAKAAVGQIQSDNLNEIRSFKTPPPAIVDVLSAVLKLLGIRDTSWLSMKKFLGQRGVKDQVLQFDARSMTPSVRTEVEKIVNEKSSSFDPSNIQRTSKAAAPLSSWVKANLQYSAQLEKVAPLENKRQQAEEELTSSRNKIDESEREIAEIDEKVAELKEQFKVRTSEAEKVRSDLEKTEKTLNKAQDLLDKLSGERERWRSTVGQLENSIEQLTPKMLLAAAFMTYLGGCDEKQRETAFSAWQKICPLQSESDFRSMLVGESEVLEWKSKDLPTDALSVENALIILAANTMTKRTPYIIDPAGTAVRWLQRMFSGDAPSEEESKEGEKTHTEAKNSTSEWSMMKGNSMEVVAAGDNKLQTQLELAVRFGKTILITGMDNIEPALYPILRRDIYNQGSRTMIPVGDKILDFNEGFEVYIATKTPSPNLPPNAAALVTEANFTVTRSGLQGQLLGVTIAHEKPELEKQKTELLAQEEAYKMQLSQLERQLVELLATSQGNILENDALIQSLTATKTKSAEIESALEGSAKASAELDRQRNVYKPFATAGGELYFLITSVRIHNHMYQFSLENYTEWFQETLDESSDEGEVSQRVQDLIPALEKRVVTTVGRSLFKADRLIFALHVVHGMRKEMFAPNEWEFFVGELVPDVSEKQHPEFPQWGPPDRHSLFSLFVQTFPQLYSQLQLHDGSWERWAHSPQAEIDFPSHASSLSKFEKLLIVQVLRPDRLVSAMANFVCEALDLDSVDPPPSSFKSLQNESANKPVMMITTAGADPSADLKEFAGVEVGENNYVEVAMGGGQQDIALQALRDGAANGSWVCLKNLHLVMDWLPTLTKEVASLYKSPSTDSRFRLWLTTEAHDSFPSTLLQDSLKVTYEAPPGLKKNIKRTYDAWPASLIENGSEVRAQLLFLLAWFHGIVQERRTYVPQGWTKPYEFSFADLRAAVQTLDAMLHMFSKKDDPQEAADVPWTFLQGLMENAIYGGRIDNGYDARVLRCYLRQWFQNGVLSQRCGGGGKQLARGIEMPHSNKVQDFLPLVDNLPEADHPSVFFLPPNIEKSVQRANSLSILSGLQSMHVAAQVEEGFDKKAWSEKLGPIIDLWEQLAGVVDAREVRNSKRLKEQEADSMSPVTDFIRLESELSLRIRNIVEKDMEALKQLLFGTASLTSDLQALGKALLTDVVPPRWAKEFEGPESPRAWLRAFMMRQQALGTEWIPSSIERTVLNKELDLGTLYRPQAFLNALRQTTARVAGVSTDELKLLAAFDKSRLEGSSESPIISLRGLLLQGAALDESNEVLQEVRADAPEVQPLPALHVKWAPTHEKEPYDSKEASATPLYATIKREQLLTRFSLPIPRAAQTKIVLAGTALILQNS